MKLKNLKLTTLAYALVLSAGIGCSIKEEGAKLNSGISSLKLSGFVVDAEGKPVEAAEVFYGVSNEVAAKTSSDGSYIVEVGPKKYKEMANIGNTHYVFARKGDDMLASSSPLNIKEKSEQTLGAMVLKEKSYAIGNVWKHQMVIPPCLLKALR